MTDRKQLWLGFVLLALPACGGDGGTSEPAVDAAVSGDVDASVAVDTSESDLGLDTEPDTPFFTTSWRSQSSRPVPATFATGPCMDAHAADVDGDDDLDLVLALEGPPNIVFENDGAARFSVRSIPAFSGRNGDSEDALVGDLNGDGLVDLFFAAEDNENDELYLQTADGAFEYSDTLPEAAPTNGAILVDLDGDEDLDVVLANRGANFIWLQEAGALVPLDSIPDDPITSQDVEAGDIDGDGDLDLVFANEGPNALWLQQPDGTFVDASDGLAGEVAETREIDLADLDGDNDLDLVLANVGWGSLPPQNQVLEQTSPGVFEDRTASAMPISGATTLDLDAVDLDYDGDLDLIAAEAFIGPAGLVPAPVTILENRGGWSFVDVTADWLPDAPQALGTDIEVADFDGDGLPDIYVCSRGGEDLLLFGE